MAVRLVRRFAVSVALIAAFGLALPDVARADQVPNPDQMAEGLVLATLATIAITTVVVLVIAAISRRVEHAQATGQKPNPARPYDPRQPPPPTRNVLGQARAQSPCTFDLRSPPSACPNRPQLIDPWARKSAPSSPVPPR